MTLRARTESSQSGSHMIIIIQDFTLVTLTSIITPHLVGLLLRAAVSSHPMYSTTYILNSSLPIQSESLSGYRNYLCFVHLLRNEIYHFLSVTGWRGIEFLVGCNQTFSFMKTSALSLVLVRV